MKTFALVLACLATTALAGCNPGHEVEADNNASSAATDGSATTTTSREQPQPSTPEEANAVTENSAVASPSTESGAPAGDDAAPADAREVALTPENTTIQFVGTHVGDDPRPRTGTFQQFTGKAVIAQDQLQSVSVEIETESLTTGIDRLTGHLKTPDFFNVREYPRASFRTTRIEPAGEGQVSITGDLTLLEVTRPVTFPASVSTTDGLSLHGQLTIDRNDFGMNYNPEGVEKDVEITVTVRGQ